MYTVIIQSHSAKESYDEFYPLLANTVYEKSDVKVCEWIEDATNLGTAVPELMNAVERKKQWRAIVVQLDLGDENSGNQTVDGNPYDFVDNQQQSFQDRILRGDIAWSDIPLVRITQMLKGIPEPVPEFEDGDDEPPKRGKKKPAEGDKQAEEENDDGFIAKKPMEFTFDQPDLTEEKKNKVIEWNEACLSQFAPPAEILLVRVRRRINSVRSYEIENKWGAHWDTIDSSRFRWKNGYSDGCRFLVFDVDAHGELRRRNDMFRLWLCVQLLAENRINSNTLQADRLYRMDVTLEEKKLAENLQKTANLLNFAQYESVQHLKEAQQTAEPEEEETAEEEEGEAEDIRIDKTIEVDLGDVDTAGFQVFEDTFPLTPENGVQDRTIWRSYTDNARQQWTKLLRAVSRRLAAAARTLHTVSQPDPEKVVPLDEYREEDLRDRLDEHYIRILEEQEKLPANEFDLNDDLEKRDKEVRRAIRGRLRTRSAMLAWILPSLLIALSMCYGFISGGSPLWLGIAIGAAVLLIILVVWIVVRIRFGSFVRTLRDYEDVYLQALLVLDNGSSTYSSFFSRIASRIYGENYLAVLELQRARKLEQNENLQRKIRKVEWFQETLERWCEALQLDVDMDNREAVRAMAESKYHPREENLYQLETGLPRSVEIGHTGSYVRTAYDFIDRMTIEREEVFGRE